MAQIWVRLRLIPAQPLDRSQLESKLKQLFPEFSLSSCWTQPIGFGIDSWILELIAPEQEGVLDLIESKLESQQWISSWELIQSGRMIRIKSMD